MRISIATFFCLLVVMAKGQAPAGRAAGILQLPTHGRLVGLGGVNVSLADRDINFFHNNPALAGDTLNGRASAAYQFFVADIGSALLTYAADLGRAGQLVFGIRHIGYGSLQGYDESGNETQEYLSGETALSIGRTHRVGNFRIGATIKAVFSNIAGYRSRALLMDLGGIFKHPDQDLAVGLVFTNIGILVSEHTGLEAPNVPFDVQTGITFKPEYMPLRFSFTGYNLRPGFDYGVAGLSPLEKVFSHLTLGAEILLHRNVNALAGYNHRLRQALQWEAGASVSGISYGLSVLVEPVEFVFSRSAYAAGNAGYAFTLSMNTNHFLKRRY